MIISDLTERELIARIQERLPPAPGWLLVGIGDDAAVVEPERNRVEVLSVDSVVEGVHFDRRFVPADAIGHRALAVNLSDLAAMGAAPRLALVAMALPAALPLADFDGIVSGLAAIALGHRLHIAGGNLTRSPGPVMIDVTVVGTVKRRQALMRSGAHVGDDIYVSGSIGAASAGLQILRDRIPNGSLDNDDHLLSRDSPGTGDRALATAVAAYLYPVPRVRLGVLLSRNRAAAACMDLSDGLADGAHQIAAASGVGIAIDSDRVPIDATARDWLRHRSTDAHAAVVRAMTGGDDYELLVAARPRMRRRLEAAARHAAVPLTRIGSCTAEREVTFTCAGGPSQPMPRGYTHFR